MNEVSGGKRVSVFLTLRMSIYDAMFIAMRGALCDGHRLRVRRCERNRPRGRARGEAFGRGAALSLEREAGWGPRRRALKRPMANGGAAHRRARNHRPAQGQPHRLLHAAYRRWDPGGRGASVVKCLLWLVLLVLCWLAARAARDRAVARRVAAARAVSTARDRSRGRVRLAAGHHHAPGESARAAVRRAYTSAIPLAARTTTVPAILSCHA